MSKVLECVVFLFCFFLQSANDAAVRQVRSRKHRRRPGNQLYPCAQHFVYSKMPQELLSCMDSG